MLSLPQNIRTRLTFGNVLMLAIVLVIYALCASGVLLWDLRSQLARYAIQDLETVEGLLTFDPGGRIHFRDDYHNHPESRNVQERYLEVLSPTGEILFRNDRLGKRDLAGALLPSEGEGGYSPRMTRLSDGTPVLLVSRLHTMNGRRILIRLAYNEGPLWEQFTSLLTALLIALPGALAVTGFAGYQLARRALSPIETMAERAEQITPDKLHERLPVTGVGDELERLARVFNGTLTRLEQAFEQMQRFTADASHELRTPLTAIRSVGEVGLQQAKSPDQYQEVIGSMLEEANRLARLVDNLLTISRADAGQVSLQTGLVRIMDVVGEAVSLLDVLADEKSQILRVEGDETVVVEGDRLVLRQAVVNVLHNAIKFSPVGGNIDIRVWKQSVHVYISITDSGPGIMEEHWGKVFHRFYRADAGRASEQGGTGLGLAIALWAVEAHKGKISLNSAQDRGASFRIELGEIVRTQDRL